MALTKVTKSGITDNAIDADKIEDGTVVAADIAPGTITDAKLASTLDLSAKTVTLPNCGVSNAQLAGSIANAKLANSSITINGSSVSLGGSVSAGQVSWQSVKTADFTAVAGEGYFVDTNSVGAVTATLPGSPSAGDTIAFKDYAANFGTNALTIARNGNNIQGVANNSSISTNRASIVLVYIDATKGWLYTNESNVADLEEPQFVSATGGTITTDGDYKIHTFTGDGCFVVATAGSGTSAEPSVVDYLVVAGGGGGGVFNNAGGGGGGGGGGFRESKASASPTHTASPHTASPLIATTGITVTATTYPITVGSGGSGAATSGDGTNGSNSVFSTITSAGGGFGSVEFGGPGGSGGGGGGAANASPPTPAGTGNTPPVSPPQGQNGGTGNGNPSPGSRRGGGGGGAGAAGGPSASCGGVGGNGVNTSITGSSTGYSGGGGGSNVSPGAGATSFGATPGTPGTSCNASANTGGGAGGSNSSAGSGGKGIVVIRYKFQ